MAIRSISGQQRSEGQYDLAVGRINKVQPAVEAMASTLIAREKVKGWVGVEEAAAEEVISAYGQTRPRWPTHKLTEPLPGTG